MTRERLTVAGLLALLTCMCLAPVSAAPGEDSVYDWWVGEFGSTSADNMNLVTYSDSTHNGSGYHGANGSNNYRGTWTNGDAYSGLRVEHAGWASHNALGWYGWTWDADNSEWDPINDTSASNYEGSVTFDGTGDPDGPHSATQQTFSLHEMFDGSAVEDAVWDTLDAGWYGNSGSQHPDRWGFYLDTEDDTLTSYAGTWYSEWAYNDRTDYANQVHVEVFDDGYFDPSYGWVLAWEDLYQGAGTHGWGSTDWSDFETGNTPAYDYHGEPDYNDMIVRFRMQDEYGRTPPVPELGTWVLLLATGAFGGWLKRRRKED